MVFFCQWTQKEWKKEQEKEEGEEGEEEEEVMEHSEVLALIVCKQVGHVIQKGLVDPRAHMVSIAQKRNNILGEL